MSSRLTHPALERASPDGPTPRVEVFLERITNMAMGTELDNINEFDNPADSPESASLIYAQLD